VRRIAPGATLAPWLLPLDRARAGFREPRGRPSVKTNAGLSSWRRGFAARHGCTHFGRAVSRRHPGGGLRFTADGASRLGAEQARRKSDAFSLGPCSSRARARGPVGRRAARAGARAACPRCRALDLGQREPLSLPWSRNLAPWRPETNEELLESPRKVGRLFGGRARGRGSAAGRPAARPSTESARKRFVRRTRRSPARFAGANACSARNPIEPRLARASASGSALRARRSARAGGPCRVAHAGAKPSLEARPEPPVPGLKSRTDPPAPFFGRPLCRSAAGNRSG